MKFFLPILIATFALVIVPNALAQSDTSVPAKRMLAKQIMMDDKEASREGKLMAALAKFKDKKKAATVERISNNLNAINKTRTSVMVNNLSRFAAILANLKSSVGQTSQITDAETMIATANSAVTTQVAKDYTLVVSSEQKVKDVATAARDQLKLDLKTTSASVEAARTSVITALNAAKVGS